MSSTDATAESATTSPPPKTGEVTLEVVTVPVSDVDRAKQFYAGLGWREDADIVAGETFRVVQFTPPGSGCSIAFGKGITTAEPGSSQRSELAVNDIDAAREDLISRGVEHDPCLVQRSRRQRVAAPGDQGAPAGTVIGAN